MHIVKNSESINDIILKRACGFSYTEETKEFERKKNVKYLWCKKWNRIYFESGSFLGAVIKGEKIALKNEVKFCNPSQLKKENKKFFVLKKSLK